MCRCKSSAVLYYKIANVVNYVYGIGGRDTKADDTEKVFNDLLEKINNRIN